jgi:hypothetical protein
MHGLISAQTYQLLQNGHFLLNEGQFRVWYLSERQKRRWPSQKKRVVRPKRGRPSLQTEPWGSKILLLVEQGAWQTTLGFNTLRHLLTVPGEDAPPGPDTLRAYCQKLWIETGDERLRPLRRPRRNLPASQKKSKKS